MCIMEKYFNISLYRWVSPLSVLLERLGLPLACSEFHAPKACRTFLPRRHAWNKHSQCPIWGAATSNHHLSHFAFNMETSFPSFVMGLEMLSPLGPATPSRDTSQTVVPVSADSSAPFLTSLPGPSVGLHLNGIVLFFAIQDQLHVFSARCCGTSNRPQQWRALWLPQPLCYSLEMDPFACSVCPVFSRETFSITFQPCCKPDQQLVTGYFPPAKDPFLGSDLTAFFLSAVSKAVGSRRSGNSHETKEEAIWTISMAGENGHPKKVPQDHVEKLCHQEDSVFT